jgi:4-azaleucine resistance transporter AzlC
VDAMIAARSEVRETNDFIRGIQAGLSIAIGYIPVALTYGLLAKSTGLTLWEAISMSIFVFAGAAQFITLNLIALGTGGIEIILTIFMVNIRHLLMSASIGEKSEKAPKYFKAIYSFFITDETFSISATREGKLTTKFMFGIGITSYSSWVVSSGLGYLIGSGLPKVLQEGMSIALYAMFIGLLVPSAKKSRKFLYLAGLAAAINTLLMQIPGMSVGWAIIIATICSSISIELLGKRGETANG